MKAMQFNGPSEFVEFWHFLKDETPRGLGVVVAAYFDERLGDLLNNSDGNFFTRINVALAARILTENEHDDLHVMRKLRNDFAHNLKANTFDAGKTQQINSLKTWQIAVAGFPQYAAMFPNAEDRLLYVAACFHLRLKNPRQMITPLPEPPLWESDSWIVVTGT